MKIPKQLWVIQCTDPKRNITDGLNLAYMTYYEDNAAFRKRQQTGENWVRSLSNQPENGQVFDNIPLSGFTVIKSVSRWSTSNKFFRVKDPRGFVVEIPTDNLAQLLQSTTVKKGVIQDDCIWVRADSLNILVPIISPEYDAIVNLKKKTANIIPVADLRPGDSVITLQDAKSTVPGKSTRYLGAFYMTWKVTHIKRPGFSSWGGQGTEQIVEVEYVTDKQPTYLFEYSYQNGGRPFYDSIFTKKSVKVTQIIGHADPIDISQIPLSRIYQYPPRIRGSVVARQDCRLQFDLERIRPC